MEEKFWEILKVVLKYKAHKRLLEIYKSNAKLNKLKVTTLEEKLLEIPKEINSTQEVFEAIVYVNKYVSIKGVVINDLEILVGASLQDLESRLGI